VTRAVAVSLKIPDNAAYTALVALRRLGVAAERVERSDIWTFEDDDAAAESLEARVEADETIFNPNKHRLTLLDQPAPRAGEVWIRRREATARGPAAVAWRLFDARGVPAGRELLAAAVERLLCNPAIETAVYSP
jgi:phosphoribosylformylglycinamidine (FGAM) synthase PurS component